MKDVGYAIWKGTLLYITANGNAKGTTLFPNAMKIKFINEDEVEKYIKNGVELLSEGSINPIEHYYPAEMVNKLTTKNVGESREG